MTLIHGFDDGGDDWKKFYEKKEQEDRVTRSWQRGQLENKIDMALMTGDRAWFHQLADAK